jgi:Protein of unknown function (DUF3800)
MYLLYLDDSGSVDNRQEQYLVLGGICVFERQVDNITGELDKIAVKIDSAKPDEVEFHASVIFSGRENPWKQLTKKDDRQQVIKDVLAVLSNAYETERAFATVVHKASTNGRDPMEVAFEDVCTRFEMFLNRVNDVGLIILDESTHQTRLVELSKEFRKRGNQWSTPLRRIVDAPMFVSSRSFRCVQLADHIAYSVFRRFDARDANYFDVFAHRFDSQRGVMHGLRHVEAAVQSTCTCPSCLSRRVIKGVV